MFAALAIERDPLSYADLPAGIITFLQAGGGFAAFGLAIWVLAHLLRRLTVPAGRRPTPVFDPFGGFLNLEAPGGTPSAGPLDRLLARGAPALRRLFVIAVVAAAVVYLALGALESPDLIARVTALLRSEAYTAPPQRSAVQQLLNGGLALAGGLALFAVLLPFAVDLLRVRWRRIWALAKLTVLEIIRRRVLWVFLLLALVFLFGTWFIDSKPENQVRSYVQVVYLTMAVLILLTSSLLASFSIPNDIKQQTIHTITTKPVELYEIFLGRFVGYTVVMTVVLGVMTSFSLLYIFRGVDPDAAAESERARVPIYGDSLRFEGTPDAEKGENVGMEWEYRGYISGPQGGSGPPQYAIWSLGHLPAELARRTDPVPVEFTFAIYRTTIGELNKGVFCTFTAESWLWDKAMTAEWQAERKRLKDEQRSNRALTDQAIEDQLAEKYGIYELPSKEVTNFHTQRFDLPVGLFKNYFRPRDEVVKEFQELKRRADQGESLSPAEQHRLTLLQNDVHGDARPPLTIRVRCISKTQFVGMARYDLYLLDREGRFWVNFYKGAVGIWFWTELIITVALACSTYLSGVITWISVIFLFITGMFRQFALQIATGKNEGGGPAESLVRLFERQNAILPLQQSTMATVATDSDKVYSWVLHRFVDILPDVDRYDFSSIVANGFNVSGETLTLTLLLLAGYLLLWVVLAYYLIKTREIAIPT